MEHLASWTLHLAGGLIGGTFTGGVLEKLTLGPLLNSLLGLCGGWVGVDLAQSAGLLPYATRELDAALVLGSLGSSCIAGALVMAFTGLARRVVVAA